MSQTNRYFLELAYLGTHYNGWQIQKNTPHTVQAQIEKSLHILLGQETPIIGQGRTDTGVHAEQSYAHFDVQAELPPNFQLKLNSLLPADISVLSLSKVTPDAHARFTALTRTYQYRIHHFKNPFLTGKSTFYHRIPDMERIHQALPLLLGRQDFECFSKVKTEVKTFFCDIQEARVEPTEHGFQFVFTADRFLRNMVRAMVGTLLEIGWGKRQVHELTELIESKNRSQAGTSVPPDGLFLTQVRYPERIFTPHVEQKGQER